MLFAKRCHVLWFFMLCATAAATDPVISQGLRLAPIPDDSPKFLQQPKDFTIDKSGTIYVLDNMTRAIFMWHADGTYKGQFGEKGQGPGEFAFNANHAQGFIGWAHPERIIIFDGALNRLSYFGKAYKYQKATSYLAKNGKILQFKITAGQKILLLQEKFDQAKPLKQVILCDLNFDNPRTLLEISDQTFLRKEENGRTTHITIKAFEPEPSMHYNAASGEMILGLGDQPHFKVHHIASGKEEKISLALKQETLSKELKTEFANQPWLRGNDFFSTQFPEFLPYYQKILPHGKNYFFLYNQSPVKGSITGVIADRNGKLIRRARYQCGEGGSLFGARGRIFAVTTDEDGLFLIHELTFF